MPFCKKIGINRSSLSWYLFKLVNENRLVRTGRGMYAEVMKQTFAPKPVKEVKEIYELLHANFPFAQHHLSSNRIIYAETNRDSTETVFNFLKGKQRNAYLRPDKKMIYRYVDLDSRVFFVKILSPRLLCKRYLEFPCPRWKNYWWIY